MNDEDERLDEKLRDLLEVYFSQYQKCLICHEKYDILHYKDCYHCICKNCNELKAEWGLEQFSCHKYNETTSRKDFINFLITEVIKKEVDSNDDIRVNGTMKQLIVFLSYNWRVHKSELLMFLSIDNVTKDVMLVTDFKYCFEVSLNFIHRKPLPDILSNSTSEDIQQPFDDKAPENTNTMERDSSSNSTSEDIQQPLNENTMERDIIIPLSHYIMRECSKNPAHLNTFLTIEFFNSLKETAYYNVLKLYSEKNPEIVEGDLLFKILFILSKTRQLNETNRIEDKRYLTLLISELIDLENADFDSLYSHMEHHFVTPNELFQLINNLKLSDDFKLHLQDYRGQYINTPVDKVYVGLKHPITIDFNAGFCDFKYFTISPSEDSVSITFRNGTVDPNTKDLYYIKDNNTIRGLCHYDGHLYGYIVLFYKENIVEHEALLDEEGKVVGEYHHFREDGSYLWLGNSVNYNAADNQIAYKYISPNVCVCEQEYYYVPTPERKFDTRFSFGKDYFERAHHPIKLFDQYISPCLVDDHLDDNKNTSHFYASNDIMEKTNNYLREDHEKLLNDRNAPKRLMIYGENNEICRDDFYNLINYFSFVEYFLVYNIKISKINVFECNTNMEFEQVELQCDNCSIVIKDRWSLEDIKYIHTRIDLSTINSATSIQSDDQSSPLSSNSVSLWIKEEESHTLARYCYFDKNKITYHSIEFDKLLSESNTFGRELIVENFKLLQSVNVSGRTSNNKREKTVLEQIKNKDETISNHVLSFNFSNCPALKDLIFGRNTLSNKDQYLLVSLKISGCSECKLSLQSPKDKTSLLYLRQFDKINKYCADDTTKRRFQNLLINNN